MSVIGDRKMPLRSGFREGGAIAVRFTLQPGEKKTVHFKLGKDELTYWSSATRSWVEETEQFDVWVGDSSKAAEHATFRVIP